MTARGSPLHSRSVSGQEETTQNRVVSLHSADNNHPRAMAEASQRTESISNHERDVLTIDNVRYRSGDYREPPENVLVIAKPFPTAFAHAYSWSIHKPSISYGRQQ